MRKKNRIRNTPIRSNANGDVGSLILSLPPVGPESGMWSISGILNWGHRDQKKTWLTRDHLKYYFANIPEDGRGKAGKRLWWKSTMVNHISEELLTAGVLALCPDEKIFSLPDTVILHICETSNDREFEEKVDEAIQRRRRFFRWRLILGIAICTTVLILGYQKINARGKADAQLSMAFQLLKTDRSQAREVLDRINVGALDDHGAARYHYTWGLYHFVQCEPERSIHHFSMARKIYQNANIAPGAHISQIYIANALSVLGRFDQAADQLKGLHIANLNPDSQAAFHLTWFNYHVSTHDYESAHQAILKAERLIPKLSTVRKETIYRNLSLSYLLQKDTDRGLRYLWISSQKEGAINQSWIHIILYHRIMGLEHGYLVSFFEGSANPLDVYWLQYVLDLDIRTLPGHAQ